MPNSLRNKIKHFCYKGYLSERERDRLLNALESQRWIPEDASNGDVIKAMFPNTTFFKSDAESYMYTQNDRVICDFDWWNEPYKAESEDKE